MNIRQALKTKLLATTAVTDLITARLYPMRAPDDATFPFLIYKLISSSRDYSHDGAVGLVESRFNIECRARVYEDAVALADAVRLTLSGTTGTWGDRDIGNCELINESDGFDFIAGADEEDCYVIPLDFTIWHDEATS